MVPDHGTKYEENSFNHHGGMHEDKQMDRLNPFLNSPNPLQRSREIKWMMDN